MAAKHLFMGTGLNGNLNVNVETGGPLMNADKDANEFVIQKART